MDDVSDGTAGGDGSPLTLSGVVNTVAGEGVAGNWLGRAVACFVSASVVTASVVNGVVVRLAWSDGGSFAGSAA